MKKILIIPTGGIGMDGITSCILNYFHCMENTEMIFTFIITKAIHDRETLETFKKKIQDHSGETIELQRTQLLSYFRRLIQLMKQEKYDVIHVHGSSSLISVELLAARMAGIPVRITHSHNTTCDHKVLNLLLKPLMNLLCTTRLACGEAAGRWLYGRRQFQVMKNGVNLDKFCYSAEARDRMRKEYGLKDCRVIGHVGGFNRQKNHTFLLDIFSEAVKADPNARLVLIGDGYLRPQIEEKIKRLHLEEKILLLGLRSDVNELIQGMDVMVMPSLYEGLPLVAVEWQAAGLPVLLTDTITQEAKIADNVEFERLDAPAAVWAKRALQMSALPNNPNAAAQVRAAGYDIADNAQKLRQLYLTSC